MKTTEVKKQDNSLSKKPLNFLNKKIVIESLEIVQKTYQNFTKKVALQNKASKQESILTNKYTNFIKYNGT